MNQLTPQLILGLVAAYFLLLLLISYLTSRKADSDDFFVGGRQSPWFLVAFGMIGASLSGVTFISIPGAVGATPEFLEQLTGEASVRQNIYLSYMQMVLGYVLGYAVIALVLLPIYYKMNLTSIYTYLGNRFGVSSYKTGAAFFLVSRTAGASMRLFLVAIVLQKFVMDAFGIPLWMTVSITILLIWIYTFQGGIKTIVWTDALQTIFMVSAVVLTILALGSAMNTDLGGLIATFRESEYSKIFFFEEGWSDPNNFFKQFFAGALITIVMTGLDQDMMQKNLSCRNIGDAQKNMFTLSIILVFVNLLFLTLGGLLFIYAEQINFEFTTRTDQLYPTLALQHLSPTIGVVFILGLIAAAYSSADSALTSLTTSFCVDFLDFNKKDRSEQEKKRTRLIVHLGFSLLLFATIMFVNSLNDDSIINKLFQFAGYSYGPLLGLFTFGMFTNYQLKNKYVFWVCLAAPLLAYFLNIALTSVGVNLGFLVLALNGLLTFLGLLAISERRDLIL
ncbi:MAG: sodium:solute symporter [Bacteroidota bacterium]